jgi:hypothetical protein
MPNDPFKNCSACGALMQEYRPGHYLGEYSRDEWLKCTACGRNYQTLCAWDPKFDFNRYGRQQPGSGNPECGKQTMKTITCQICGETRTFMCGSRTTTCPPEFGDCRHVRLLRNSQWQREKAKRLRKEANAQLSV